MAVKPLNHYSLTTPASVYDEEALTALELASRTAAKVNENVEAFNKLEKETGEHLEAQDAAIQKMNDITMPAKVDAEVKEHIENGDFDKQIDESLGNLNDRVDNLLGSVTEGSTTMDAEIIDARVDNHGYARTNLGTSIRAQIFDAFSLANTTAIIGQTQTMDISVVKGRTLIKLSTPSFDLRKCNSSTITEKISIVDSTKNAEIINAITANDDGSYTLDLPDHTGLVYNVHDKAFHFRSQNRQQYGDVMLLGNAFERVFDGVLLKEHNVKQHEKVIKQAANTETTVKNMGIARNCYLYIGYDNRPLFQVEPMTNPGGSYMVQLPLNIGKNDFTGNGNGIDISESTVFEYTWETFLLEITDTYARFRIPANHFMVYDVVNGQIGIVAPQHVTNNHAVLLANNWAKLSEGQLLPFLLDREIEEMKDDIEALNEETKPITPGRSGDVAALYNTDNRTDSFLFVTDLHPVWDDTGWLNTVNRYVQHIKKNFDLLPLDFVLSGGDWLNNATNQHEACHALGAIYGKMKAAFGDKAHLLLGNHDTNYQGKKTDSDANNTGTLSTAVINKLWYKDHGRSYYDFETANAKYFLFDSGIDWYPEINAAKKEQINYFIEKLKTNTKPFIVLTSHIIKEGGSNYSPFASTLCEIATAFNNRTSYTYDGVAHNFAGCTGEVKLLIGGHTHNDETGTINGIPFFITKNYSDGQAFDFCVIDFDAGVVKLIREGSGGDRTLNLN